MIRYDLTKIARHEDDLKGIVFYEITFLQPPIAALREEKQKISDSISQEIKAIYQQNTQHGV